MKFFSLLVLSVSLSVSVNLTASVSLTPELPIDCSLEENNKKTVEVLYNVKELSMDEERAVEFKFFKGYCEDARIKLHMQQDYISINAWSDEFLFPWDDLPYGVAFEQGEASFHSLRISFSEDILEGKQERSFPISIERYRSVRMNKRVVLKTFWKLTFERTNQGDVQVSIAQRY